MRCDRYRYPLECKVVKLSHRAWYRPDPAVRQVKADFPVIDALIGHKESFDFMSDRVYCGERFRVVDIIDAGLREVLDIVVDTSSRWYGLSGFCSN